MTAKQYINQVLENNEKKHADKPEFIQAVKEFFPTLEPYLDEHPEIEQFFTKHFGEIIPPENTKLYNKTYPNTSISDQSLLNKLNQVIKTAGLDKSKDFNIELEIGD